MRIIARMSQSSKQCSLWIALWVLSLFLLFVYFEGEVSRLDAARERLEAQWTSRNGGFVQIRRAAEYTGTLQDSPGETSSDFGLAHQVIIYNRVPKTGSTSFAGIAYDLCSQNKFNVLHLNVTKNNHVLSVADQRRFVTNVTNWLEKKPALYHGHLAYLDFAKFGATQRPIYINIVRDPLDRLVSYYYFLRNGDDFRPHLKRRKSGNRETFDACVLRELPDCDPENLWMQIPFFCGHAAECWIPGNKWALQMAKQNLINNYLVVGVTDELSDFIAVLEAALPRFFRGASHLFVTGTKSHLRKTYNKKPLQQSTIDRIKESEIWSMENEFYEFARDHFNFVKKRAFELASDGSLMEKRQQFSYEKIRPR